MSDPQANVAAAIASARARCGIPDTVSDGGFQNLIEMFEHCVERHPDAPAATSLGNTLTYRELEQQSARFGAWLHHDLGLKPGDAMAIQMPNLVQYLVVLWGAIRAGVVVVNTNPLYSAREIKHQFNDANVKAAVVLANMAATLAEVVDETPVEQVIITELADCHPLPKRLLINLGAKYIKKLVPDYDIPGAVSLRECLKKGRKGALPKINAGHDDLAILQYTGGTTGVSKGAMLSHGNLIFNVMQGLPVFETFDQKEAAETFIIPLPLYHIYSFTLSLSGMMRSNHAVLIPDPRDLDSLVDTMSKVEWTGMCGINTLFVSLCNHEGFKQLDFSKLKVTLSGGMALTAAAAKRWESVTGCKVSEGYGLTETSPVVSINPGGNEQIGTIGVTVPGTEIMIKDDEGNALDIGEAGELCVRGPQVMQGYWQRPEDTAKSIVDGFFATGDVAVVQDDGYMKIVDRKKDMIIVSGFNVFPNEIEDVVCSHDDVAEAAAIGVPDEKSGEAVKVFVVPVPGKELDLDALKAHMKANLTGYKMPRHVEVREELPKSNVGKILRRELRDEAVKQ